MLIFFIKNVFVIFFKSLIINFFLLVIMGIDVIIKKYFSSDIYKLL